MSVILGLIIIILLDFYIEDAFFNKKLKSDNDFWYGYFKKLLSNRTLTILSIIVISTFKSIAGEVVVGLDTKNYLNFFNNVSTLPAFGENTFEIGYYIINYLAYIFGLGFRGVLLITSLIVSKCFKVFIDQISCDKKMSWVLFVALGVFAQSLNLMRQFLAVSFILLSFVAVYKNKNVWAVLWILCACLFHKSAIIMLVIPLFKYVKLNWITSIISAIIVVVLSFLLVYGANLLPDISIFKYIKTYFIESRKYIGESSILNNAYSFALALMFVVFLIVRDKCLTKDSFEYKRYDFFLKLYLFVPLARLAGFVMNAQELLNRVSVYFFLSLLILIPLCYQAIKRKMPKLIILSEIGIYAISFGYMFYLYAIKLTCGVIPFMFGV